MIVLRTWHRRKKRRNPMLWLVTMAALGMLLLALTGCTSIESLCWKPNANKTCPSILDLGA